ncbi:exodeoxyribonuclease VII large subunit [Natronomonas sp. EA1]|uniref:exodeoxyribonuclease VII large subunit n=1 Tax=Natronomonas sp. EA1 TaxID=3421655 RepID=UPI003EBB0D9D
MADAEREVDDVLSGNVLSVQELNDRIASVVQDTPALNGVRCIGEVTDLHQNSTALYFTLTDGNAELPCMLWANRYQKMDADLEDGTEVILEGDIDYWTEGGKIVRVYPEDATAGTAWAREIISLSRATRLNSS